MNDDDTSSLHHHAKVADSIEDSLKNAGFDYYDLVSKRFLSNTASLTSESLN